MQTPSSSLVLERLEYVQPGCAPRDVRPEQLADAVRLVAAGDALLAPAITRRLVEQFVRCPPPGSAKPPELADLTERELGVLVLVARGLSNKEIASASFLTEAIVKTHLTHILTKLNLRDRVQAVVLAYELGLVQPGEAPTARGMGSAK